MEKVSIIVPVFNVEDYLEECIRSLLDQSYKNIEIILINDGSTDHSSLICNNLKEIDNRIILINQKNLGVSSARNVGLSIASGEYILFVDSDDIVHCDYVKKMVNSINNIDMVICGYVEKYKILSIPHKVVENEMIINNISAISKMFDREYYGGYLWNKLFKKSIIDCNNITFDSNIHMCEDLLFVSKYLCKCTNIIVIPDLLYNYRMRESSAVWNKNSNKYESLFISYNKLYKLFVNNNISLDYLKYEILNSVYSNNLSIKKVEKFFNYDLSDSYKQIKSSNLISRNNKIKLFIKKNFNYIYIMYINKKVKKLEMYK